MCIAKSLSSFFGSPVKVEYPYQSSASISENPTHATPDHATPEHGTRHPVMTQKRQPPYYQIALSAIVMLFDVFYILFANNNFT